MIKKDVFSSRHERGTNRILSPHEEFNLRPSDLCFDLRFNSSWGLRIFSLSHARDKKKKNFI